MNGDENITLEEVVRNLQRLGDAVDKLGGKIDELQKNVLAEVDTRIHARAEVIRLEMDAKISAVDAKFEPVRKIVYGFVSAVLVTVAGALLALVINK